MKKFLSLAVLSIALLAFSNVECMAGANYGVTPKAPRISESLKPIIVKYKAGNYDDNKRQKEEKALKAQVLSYIELRDSLNTLLRAELDPNKSDEEIAKFRQDLNISYDKMKLKYKKPLKEAFKACDMDLSFEFISNLENEKGEKALIFSQRISSPIVEPKVSNEKEALIAKDFDLLHELAKSTSTGSATEMNWPVSYG